MAVAPLIFVSHSSIDIGLAAILRNFLRDAGLASDDCFLSSLDAAITYGGDDLEEIYVAMENCKIFIEIITPTFLERPRCLQEVGFMTARTRLAQRGELPSHQWIKILPMVVPPLTFAETSERLDRSQSPTLDSAESLQAFTDELLKYLLRADRRLPLAPWNSAVNTFIIEWLAVASDFESHINTLLRRLQPLPERYITLLENEPERIAMSVNGLPSDAIRRLAKVLSDSGSTETALIIAAQITESNVELFNAIRESLAKQPTQRTPEEALLLARRLNNPYKKRMAILLIDRDEPREAYSIAIEIDNPKERIYVWRAMCEAAMIKDSPNRNTTIGLLQDLLRTFDENDRRQLISQALAAGGPPEWFEL